jgi:hypothetical protein
MRAGVCWGPRGLFDAYAMVMLLVRLPGLHSWMLMLIGPTLPCLMFHRILSTGRESSIFTDLLVLRNRHEHELVDARSK